MPFLAFLRLCSYWLFLLYSVAFLVICLLLIQAQPPELGWAHPFTQYGVLVSLLVTLCCSVALWAGRGEDTPPSTLFVALGASLLPSAMIAALLFFL